MTHDDLLDPLIGPGFKGFPHGHRGLRRSEVARAGWNALAGDLPLPFALLKRDAIEHNLAWMQAAGAALGHRPGAARQDHDVAAALRAPARCRRLGPHLRHRDPARGRRRGRRTPHADRQPGARLTPTSPRSSRCCAPTPVCASCSSSTRSPQLALIEAWARTAPRQRCPSKCCSRSALPVAAPVAARTTRPWRWPTRLHASAAVELVGIECYEGLGAKGNTEADAPYAQALMDRVEAVARHCDAQHLFDSRRGAAVRRRLGDLRPGRDAPEARARPAGARPAALGLLRHARPWQLQALCSTSSSRAWAALAATACARRWRSGPWCSPAPNPASRSSPSASATSPSTSRCRCRSPAPRAAR